MSAPLSDDQRDRLTAAIAVTPADRCSWGHMAFTSSAKLADQIAPVVGAMLAEARAEALREAADDPSLRLSGHSGVSIKGLRDRAAALADPEATA